MLAEDRYAATLIPFAGLCPNGGTTIHPRVTFHACVSGEPNVLIVSNDYS